MNKDKKIHCGICIHEKVCALRQELIESDEMVAYFCRFYRFGIEIKPEEDTNDRD